MEIATTPRPLPDGGQLFVWTDGLEDLANLLEVHPCSLATSLLRAQFSGHASPHLSRAKDDVLAVRIHFAGGAGTTAWMPVVHEVYHGGQAGDIDLAQSRWQGSLELALPDLPESRLFDIMLTLRETVLNGIKHDCGGKPAQHCRLTVAAETAQRVVRIVVSDSGPGPTTIGWRTYRANPWRISIAGSA